MSFDQEAWYYKTLIATKVSMYFNGSARSNPNVIFGEFDPERLMGHTDALNDLLYHMSSASRYTLLQEAEIMETWTSPWSIMTAQMTSM